jgi:hypothetical protein
VRYPGLVDISLQNSGWSYAPGDFDFGSAQFSILQKTAGEALTSLADLAVTTSNGGTTYPCLATAEDHQWQVVVAAASGVTIPRMPEQLTVVPSPFSDHLTVTNASDRVLEITLCDLLGRTISTFNAEAGTSQWMLSNLPAGMYLLQWLQDGTLHSARLTKQ